jgi:hypothetical protein
MASIMLVDKLNNYYMFIGVPNLVVAIQTTTTYL